MDDLLTRLREEARRQRYMADYYHRVEWLRSQAHEFADRAALLAEAIAALESPQEPQS